MNAKKVFSLWIVATLFLGACAQTTPQATHPPEIQAQPVVQEAPQAVAPAAPTAAALSQPHAETSKNAANPPAAPMPLATAPRQPEAFSRPAPTAISGFQAWGPRPTPADNYFQNYGTNPFIDAYEDHLSTFSLDVDTASYTVARRYVQDGQLPPAEAVRVEEFVNYFHQDYPTPPEVAFAIYADGAASPFHMDGSKILRFGIQGHQVSAEQRKPASLTFVIDISGSMRMENRLELVKQALQLLVERLRPDDTVAIVVYGTEARVKLYPTSGEDRQTILQTIYTLQPEGSTNAEAGLRLGYELAMQAYRAQSTNRVILCSDGVANVGATSPDAILETIREYAGRSITLTTVGFGMGNFNDILMEQLADKGNGTYAYVDSLDEAQRLFVDNLTSTLETIAMDAKVQIDFNPDVVAYYRLIGYENRGVADQDFRNDQVDAGEIGAGHSVTALYAVQLRPGSQGRVATAQLRWRDPNTQAVQEINGNFNTWDLAPSFEHASPRYQLAVVVAEYAELLRRSPWAGEADIHLVARQAQRLNQLLPGDPQIAEFASLTWSALQISALTRH